MKNSITIKHVAGNQKAYPNHSMVSNWEFNDSNEAELANSLAVIAETNGVSKNDLSHIFPAILRMMKSTSEWSK